MDDRGTGIFSVSPMCSDSGQRIFAQQAANKLVATFLAYSTERIK